MSPLAMLGFVGVTASDTRVAAVTVRVAVAVWPPYAAVMVVAPVLLPVARPSVPAALLIGPTLVSLDVHVASNVRSWVVVSVYVPVAVNCCVVPLAIEGVGGVTWIETSVADVTVSWVVPAKPPNAAEIVTVPAAAPLAKPSVPTALLMVAMALSDELQVAEAVRSWVVVSLYVPVAVNC